MLNILVIGAGAYVCGRNTEGYGTVLPAIFEAKRNNLVNKLFISTRNASSKLHLKEKIDALSKITGVSIEYEHSPGKGYDENAYRSAIQRLPEPSCVIISTPDPMHYEMARFAIEQGKHVMVVKPLTPTTAEALALSQLAKSSKKHCVVEFHKRYDLSNLKIKQLLHEGKIGDLLYVNVEYSQKKSNPEKVFKEWSSQVNIFQYLAVHYVDVIHFVTGAIPLRALAMGQKKYLKSKGLDTFDAIQAIIEWDDNGSRFISTILCNWIDPDLSSAVSYQSMKMIGTKGRIESDQKNRGFQVVSDKEGVEDINPYFNQIYLGEKQQSVFRGYGIDSILQFLHDCSDIYNGKVEPSDLVASRPSFQSAIASSATIEAVNKSLTSHGQWVDTKYSRNKK